MNISRSSATLPSMPGRMCGAMRAFLRAEAGAVTVDWVVITAAIVGLGLVVFGGVRMGTISLGDEVKGALEDAVLASIDFGNGNEPGPDDGADDICEPGAWVPAEEPGCTTNGCELACR